MRIEQFEAILEVAQQKSMQKAAEALYTSTQNISKLIKDFEKELHIQIFIRNKHGIFLTSEGEYIVQELQIVMQTLNALKSHYLDLTDSEPIQGRIDRVHILSVPSERETASAMLEYIGDHYTLQSATLNIKDAMIINSLLKQDRDKLLQDYDFIFTNMLEPDLLQLKEIPADPPLFLLYKNRLGIHLNQHSVFSQQDSISIKDLLNEPLIAYVPDGLETTLPLLAMKNIGVSLQPKYNITSEKTCQHFIQKNMGYSLVPYLENTPFNAAEPNTVIIPLKEKVFIHHILLVNPRLLHTQFYTRIQNLLLKQYKYMHPIY